MHLEALFQEYLVGLSAIILEGFWASHNIRTGVGNNEEEVLLSGRIYVSLFIMTSMRPQIRLVASSSSSSTFIIFNNR